MHTDFTWRPDPKLAAWMRGDSHFQPPTRDRQELIYAQNRRLQAFVDACRTGDPSLDTWPEFQSGLDEMNIRLAYERSTISTIVAGLIIIEHDRSLGDWMHRGEWLQRRGKNPLKRRRYKSAMSRLYNVYMLQAKRIVGKRRFERESERMVFGVA